jgi:hypothetical protein
LLISNTKIYHTAEEDRRKIGRREDENIEGRRRDKQIIDE